MADPSSPSIQRATFRAGLMLPKKETRFAFAPRIYGEWVFVSPAILTVEGGTMSVTTIGGIRLISTHLPLVHRGKDVTLIHFGRTFPPWANSTLVLTDGNSFALVGTSSFAREKLLRAIEAAGITVHHISRRRRSLTPANIADVVRAAEGRA